MHRENNDTNKELGAPLFLNYRRRWSAGGLNGPLLSAYARKRPGRTDPSPPGLFHFKIDPGHKKTSRRASNCWAFSYSAINGRRFVRTVLKPNYCLPVDQFVQILQFDWGTTDLDVSGTYNGAIHHIAADIYINH